MPETKWTPPSSFPVYLLNNSEAIAVDTETYDPQLLKRGPSWRYKLGKIAGYCLATADRQWYFPVDHLGGNNLPKELVVEFFRDLLKTKERKVFLANGSYDLGWLWYEGILPDDINLWPDFEDIILNESLLCEDHPMGHSLDAISQRRLGRKKDESLLKAASKDLGLDTKKDLWKFPAQFVGPYGEMDARNTFDIGIQNQKDLDEEDLRRVWEVEQKIMPILHLTTRNGIPLDMDGAEELNNRTLTLETKLQDEMGLTPWTDEEKTALSSAGFKMPYTEKGTLSCTKDWLKSVADFEDGQPINLPAKILTLRSLNRLRKVYIEDAMEWAINGRVHPEFLQMANDEGGARSGRMASKHPNFQQIPSRSKLGKSIRKLYHGGDAFWAKLDYSSQEPRWQVHYGMHCGYEGAEEVCENFMQGKKLYSFMEENVDGLSYNDAKMFVLARSYGMGVTSLSNAIGLPENESKALLDKFDATVPYINQLAQHTTSVANKKGFIKTYLGRKRRFIYWEPEDKKEVKPVFGYNAAKKRWKKSKLRRSYTYRAFNGLIQGSSADQTKKAMLDAWREEKVAPFCQVHDELDYPVSNEEQAHRLKLIMEITFPDTNCPFTVDCDIGKTWQ